MIRVAVNRSDTRLARIFVPLTEDEPDIGNINVQDVESLGLSPADAHGLLESFRRVHRIEDIPHNNVVTLVLPDEDAARFFKLSRAFSFDPYGFPIGVENAPPPGDAPSSHYFVAYEDRIITIAAGASLEN